MTKREYNKIKKDVKKLKSALRDSAKAAGYNSLEEYQNALVARTMSRIQFNQSKLPN